MRSEGPTPIIFIRCRTYGAHYKNIIIVTALTDCPVRYRSFRASSITCVSAIYESVQFVELTLKYRVLSRKLKIDN